MKQWHWFVAIHLVILTWACSALVYPAMPARIPIHWNIRGQVDGYGPKSWIFLMPAVMAGMLLFFRFLPALSPRSFEVTTFRSTYLFIMVVIVGLFGYIHGLILYAAWAHVEGVARKFDFARALAGGMFLFFALLGNVMGKLKRNFYMGVRVPWTLASDRVWNDTHRVAAWLMVAGSVIGFLITITGLPLVAAFVVWFVTVLAPIPYSFIHYKRLEREGLL